MRIDKDRGKAFFDYFMVFICSILLLVLSLGAGFWLIFIGIAIKYSLIPANNLFLAMYENFTLLGTGISVFGSFIAFLLLISNEKIYSEKLKRLDKVK